jgi:hypothetical protein
MEVNSILFFGKNSGLLLTAAEETGLQHLKEEIGAGDFGADLHPGRTFPALGQVSALFGNPGVCHGLSSIQGLPLMGLMAAQSRVWP